LKQIYVITGHFGSGKTEFSVNFALDKKRQGRNVTLIDLDIVNPYFRSADARKMLEDEGVRVIAGQFVNTNLDMPSIPPEIISVFEKKDEIVIFDVGGDPEGATALGRYFENFANFDKKLYNCEKRFDKAEDLCYNDLNSQNSGENLHVYCVINERRVHTSHLENCIAMIRNIEATSRLKINGLINATHLAQYTTPDVVLKGQALAEEVGEKLGLEVKFISGISEILDKLPAEYEKIKFPIKTWLRIEN
jgi:MinD-like ATPase involved in chromosome partitioning or flagellar assembly